MEYFMLPGKPAVSQFLSAILCQTQIKICVILDEQELLFLQGIFYVASHLQFCP